MNENVDIVKLLLANKKIDVNITYILNTVMLIKFEISIYIVFKKINVLWHLKSNIPITFKINYFNKIQNQIF